MSSTPVQVFHAKNQLAAMGIAAEQLVALLCTRYPSALEDDLFGEIHRFIDRQHTGKSVCDSFWTIKSVHELLEVHPYDAPEHRLIEHGARHRAMVDGVKYLRTQFSLDVAPAALLYLLVRACTVCPSRPTAAPLQASPA